MNIEDMVKLIEVEELLKFLQEKSRYIDVKAKYIISNNIYEIIKRNSIFCYRCSMSDREEFENILYETSEPAYKRAVVLLGYTYYPSRME